VGTLPGAMSNIASMRGPAADAQRSKLNKDIRRVNQDVAAGRVQAGAGGSVRRKKGGPRSMGGGGARVFGVVRTVTGVRQTLGMSGHKLTQTIWQQAQAKCGLCMIRTEVAN